MGVGPMAYREVSVIEVREVLRGWLAGAGLRTVAAQAGVDRKTARRYVQAAEAAGVVRDGGVGQVATRWSVRWWRRCGRPVRRGTGRRGSSCRPSRSRSPRGSVRG